MSSAAAEVTPVEALDLRESISLTSLCDGNLELTEALSQRWQPSGPGSPFDDRGRVPIHIIRPGIGKGKGRHLYEADMLERHAHVFRGWKMNIDHESEQARKARGGLPRSMRDAGGIVKESFWDPDVPADPAKGHGKGAVVGLVKPTRLVRELIEDDPEIVEASIAASATGVKPVIRDGQRVWLVEGINDRGTVDWVTEAGAGGRVVALMEAAMNGGFDEGLVESLDDDEFRDWLASVRPDLKLAEAGTTDPEEGDMAQITPEALQEAISASPTLLVEALQQSSEAQDFLRQLVEATLDEEREVIRAEAKAEAQREIQLRDLRDEAHRVISESRLPESWQAGLRGKFDLVEGAPTDALDVVDEVDGEGNVTKPAVETLREAVEAEVKAERDRLAEVAPTRVRNQGGASADGSGDSKIKASETSWGRYLRESAGTDPDKAYVLRGAGEDA